MPPQMSYVGFFLSYAGPRRRHVAWQLIATAFFTSLLIVFGTAVAGNVRAAPFALRTPSVLRARSPPFGFRR